MENRNPAWWAGHIFTVITGSAFLLSGVLNAATFWATWRLNYFLIASPADVVMSGFILVTAFLVVLGVIWGAWSLVARYSRHIRAGREAAKAEIESEVDRLRQSILDALSKGVKPDASATQSDAEADWNARKAGIVTARLRQRESEILLTIAASALSILLAGVQIGLTFLYEAQPEWKFRPFWYETGLRVSQQSRVLAGRCAGAPVAWLGSSAAVLECPDGVYVVHKLDDLVTVRRFR